MKTRSWLRSIRDCVTGRPSHHPIRRAPRLGVALLEQRDVPSTVSISDATASEGGADYRFTDYFVAPNAYGLGAGREVELGPDGKVYVASHDSDAVLILEGGTGRLLGELTTPGGELDGPWGMVFGPDGKLYVTGRWSKNLVRFDVAVGSFDVLLSGDVNLGNGMTFGPDGSFYATFANGPVRRYDGVTGAYLGDFVVQGSGGLINPAHIEFGPDGNLYVTDDSTSRAIRRYDGQTGVFIDTFIAAGSGGLGIPRDIRFTGDGYLRVTDNQGYVYRFSAATGAFLDRLAAGPVGLGAVGLAIAPSGEWYVSRGGGTGTTGSFVARVAPSSFAAFTVSLDTPSASPISVSFSTANGSAIAGDDYVQTSGTLTFAPGETSRTILVRTLDDPTVEPTETFTVTLTNSVGATIADGQGVGSIFDKTRFYVVDDAADRTYEYGTTGLATENYALNNGNATPRGAASTVAGDRVWVVDANKKVYVYSASGGLLGSWTAGSLHAQAQVEGIATNGTDIWLVDAKQDKVFRYTGAASLVSGSQNAASSFNLNSGNGNPKDLVTDGTSIWVVDDAGTDKVFKYTLTGSLQGSWTFTGGGGSPTGITLDPSNGQQHLWVVDSATDRVYQYENARSRTSGTQSASVTFALAAGNTNPQGIADPPAVSIDDATANEGGTTYRFTDYFVAPDAYGLAASREVELGPDGKVYVASHDSDAVLILEGGTGRLLGELTTPGGELDGPWGMVFGPGGKLYVNGRWSQNIVRFDLALGTYTEFLPQGSNFSNGTAFGPDGNFYAGVADGPVRRYNGVTGTYLGDFVVQGSGGLISPIVIAFGPDGKLYVADGSSRDIKRYNGQTGAFIDNFVAPGSGGLDIPREMRFTGDGYLCVPDNHGYVYRFSAATGAFIDRLAAGPVGLGAPGLAIAQSGEWYVSRGGGTGGTGSFVARLAPTGFAAFTVSLDSVSTTPVNVSFNTANGTAIAGSDYAATSGTLTFAPGETTRTILVRTLDDAFSEPTETFTVNLSNPVGATLADGQAVGTIADNEPPLPRVVSVDANGAAGAQRSRVTSITVRFNAAVTFAGAVADAFALARTGGGAVGGFTASAATVNGVTVVTLANFTGAETQFGSLADGRFALTVRAAQVSANGQPLDGDGDGLGGDDYTLAGTVANGLFRLFGDVNGDGFVNAADFGQFRGAFGSSTGQASYLAFLDLDGDGFVNAFDFAQFRTRFGAGVP